MGRIVIEYLHDIPRTGSRMKVLCTACKHERREAAMMLAKRVPKRLHRLDLLEARLKCGRCGAKRAMIVIE